MVEFMARKIAPAFMVALLLAILPAGASAGVVFSDNFNSYAYQLNWVPPANWTSPGPGTVDLIGQTTTQTAFNFYPGNDGYVDLDGSNAVSGTLQTNISFLPGVYDLTFSLGGNARGDVATTTVISLGSFSEQITLNSDDPLQQFSFAFSTTGGNLTFSDLPSGNGNIGNILDNVSLASAVPEPSTWVLMILGFLGVGLMAYRKRTTVRFA